MVAFIADVWARKLVVPELLLVMWAVPALAVSVPPRVPKMVCPPLPMPGLLVIVALPAVLAFRKLSPLVMPSEPTTVMFELAAVDVLLKSGQTWEYPVAWGNDLQSEHERFLTEKHFQCPVILYNYPRMIKPFYMKVNDDGKTVRAMDVLVPGVGEIIGGSQREERLDVLEERMREQGLHPEGYSWYCDLRRYGTVPHAGFGLGLERTILFLSGMANIRDVIPFPRTPGNAEF